MAAMNVILSIVVPWRRACAACGLFLMLLCGPVLAQNFLPPDKAFKVAVSQAGPHALRVDFTLAREVYLYREKFDARVQAAGGAAGTTLTWSLPPGQPKHDPTFDKVLEVYHGDVSATLAVPDTLRGELDLTVVYQGCADAGLCYPPQKKHFLLTLDGQGQIQAVQAAAGGGMSTPMPGGGQTNEQANQQANEASDGGITQALASGHWWVVVPVFLLAGVLLSLTPCVLPMVPILSSIIVGQKGQVSRARGFALALSYSQGMALVYTALGVAAGLLGQGLAAYLQHPWVVLAFAALMVLLALSMFGLYELQLPASVQGWLGAGANRLPGGRFVGVFAMGVVSALVVSPCVSAPLAGALLYISQTRDVPLGATALYAMAWGMSLPLLLVGLSAGSLLPRTGPWMTAVKGLFGVIMLGMAVWVARPAWPYLQSLAGVQRADAAHHSVLPFQRVRSVAELDAALAQAKAQGKPVMLDFYADWCTACLEMEHDTFADPQVRVRLQAQAAVLLQADVTVNSADDRALLQRFGLFGPPGIIFYDASGQLKQDASVIGYQKPAAFLQSLQAAGFGAGV